MTPSTAPHPSAFRTASGPQARRARADVGAVHARRRRTLLQLAERHGEVRVDLRSAGGVNPSSSRVLDLLDELNEGGLLSYGGLRRSGPTVEIVYRRV